MTCGIENICKYMVRYVKERIHDVSSLVMEKIFDAIMVLLLCMNKSTNEPAHSFSKANFTIISFFDDRCAYILNKSDGPDPAA